MKSVIIPTDLTVQSLSIVHNIVKIHPGKKLIIYAVHMLNIPGDITDLMFLKKTKMYRYIPETFTEAVQALNNKYKSQVTLNFELFYGNTAAVLCNIMDSKGIAEAYLLTNYTYARSLKESADFIRFFDKCKVPVNKIPLQRKVYMQGQAHLLSALLGTEEKLPVKNKEEALAAI